MSKTASCNAATDSKAGGFYELFGDCVNSNSFVGRHQTKMNKTKVAKQRLAAQADRFYEFSLVT